MDFDIDFDVADVTVLREAARSGVMRAVRIEAGASQPEWAAAAGCTPSMISLVERGLATPRADLARRLARVLGSAIAGLKAARPKQED